MMLSVEIFMSMFGGILFILAEQHLNRITKGTRRTIKISFWSLASGSLVLTFGPWLKMPVWFIFIGFLLIMVGGLFLASFNKYECNIFGCKVLDAIIRKIRSKWENE